MLGRRWLVIPCMVLLLMASASARQRGPTGAAPLAPDAACQALLDATNITISSAALRPASGQTPEHCYIRGAIGGRIRFHMQLPLPGAWNGRLLNIGDGGKDGDLDFADHRLAQGYAVANSNTGHDSGVEPGASFGTNLDSVIDFGHRAVHLTAVVSKTVVRAYYGRAAEYTYFEGCSTGGRQGLMEAQRYPGDFDGIVAGAPVFDYESVNANVVWMAQQTFKDGFAGNLAFDTDGDGAPDSLTKLEKLRDAVLATCDAIDGIADGLIDDPLACDFQPAADLVALMCPADVDADGCFTNRQIQLVTDYYRGPRDSRDRSIRKGMALGSEFGWGGRRVAHAGNNFSPALGVSGDHFNFLFYRASPGVPPLVLNDTRYVPNKTVTPPEFAWWEFNVDDVTAGKGAFMSAILEATDPNLSRFLNGNDGKLLLYHGWGDSMVAPEPTLDYYTSVVRSTFGGDLTAARERVRLFMIPGMGHCRGGPGCDTWDRLAPLVDWVENGRAPDHLVAQHLTDGTTDNERRICAYPQQAVYVGPSGGQNDRVNWVERNFECR